MLVGYAVLGLSGPRLDGSRVGDAAAGQSGAEVAGSDSAALEALGCEKVFADTNAAARGERPNLKAALEFLRPGDVLAVTGLHRLGQDIEAIVLLVERLRRSGIALQVGRTEIVPGTLLGDAFPLACRELARLLEPTIQPDSPAGLAGQRRRGRPQALSGKDIAKARRLLAESTMTVSDVARTLGVSPATVYRYFPRRPAKAMSMDHIA